MKSRIGVAALLIAWNNENSSLLRLQRDLLPALTHLRDQLDAEVIVLDNSEQHNNRLAHAVTNCGLPHRYHWFGGPNLMSGPVINIAATITTHPYLLYLCTNHGHAYDPSWPLDLLTPLVDDPQVGMTGTLADAGPPQAMGFFNPSLSPVHIQGGVFAARTQAIRDHPYPGGQYAHWGTDIYESFALQAAGYTLKDVPTIRSVWRTTAPPGNYKYIHDETR